MSVDTSERNFEEAIEIYLAGPPRPEGVYEAPAALSGDFGGYVRRTPDAYDRERCLLPDDVLGFLIASQPETWEKLRVQYGEKTRERFLDRLAQEVKARGVLDVLRKGVDDVGCHFDLAYFRPETTLNADHARLYAANVLSVVRQLHFSQANSKSLDVVLFVNGLPVVTLELKNPLKGQTVQNAVAQYRHDRDPKEPLFALGRCVAHFAADTDLVYMTTTLRGKDTRFLPFNKGRNGGAGNPDNPRGFKTTYLWEEVLRRDALMDILAHYVVKRRRLDEEGRETKEYEVIFPRYHQLDAVRRLVADGKANGAGRNYLVQHSAGSGKSNTISWLAHRLVGLHDAEDSRVFDAVVVVTDRRVLDSQLRATIQSFTKVKGTVRAIEQHKAAELADALATGSDIIVVTLQTFPFVAEKMRGLAGRRFAVVVDEAHSSQSGEANASLRQVLTTDPDTQEPDAPDAEDAVSVAVERAMGGRGRLENVSFFAFTATPKNKTLELFGARQEDGSFRPFSLYTMRQAIDEGFILDVLENYTTYKVYYALNKKVEEDPEYSKRKATYLLRSFVDHHEHAVAQKTAVMVEHFHGQVRHRIGGQAKAMVVTRSRLSAVRYKRAFDRYLKERGYPHRALVAFSGEVYDPHTGDRFTEAGMNGVAEAQTAGEFKKPECRFLIVANKFQTGFDQPLLHTMYVDKLLGGVSAVQTLSRLNRTHPGKTDTFVLDFVNEADDIQKAFQPYYEATLLTEGTDPNKLYDLKRSAEEYGFIAPEDMEEFAALYFRPGGTQESLQPVLNRVVGRFIEGMREEQDDFRRFVRDYVRLYAFLSQIVTFQDTGLEKFYQFARLLLRKLPATPDRLPTEVTENINLDSFRIQQTAAGPIRLAEEDGALKPISDLGTGRLEDVIAPLSEIVGYLNETYGTNFTDEDKVAHFAGDMSRRLLDRDALRTALNPEVNSPDNQRRAFNEHFADALEEMMTANWDIYLKIKDDPSLAERFRELMYRSVVGQLKPENAHFP